MVYATLLWNFFFLFFFFSSLPPPSTPPQNLPAFMLLSCFPSRFIDVLICAVVHMIYLDVCFSIYISVYVGFIYLFITDLFLYLHIFGVFCFCYGQAMAMAIFLTKPQSRHFTLIIVSLCCSGSVKMFRALFFHCYADDLDLISFRVWIFLILDLLMILYRLRFLRWCWFQYGCKDIHIIDMKCCRSCWLWCLLLAKREESLARKNRGYTSPPYYQ